MVAILSIGQSIPHFQLAGLAPARLQRTSYKMGDKPHREPPTKSKRGLSTLSWENALEQIVEYIVQQGDCILAEGRQRIIDR